MAAPPPTSSLFYPTAIALAGDGSFYIADTDNDRIRRVGPDGLITTVAGNGVFGGHVGDGGLATQASFSYLYGIALGGEGSLYIADGGHFRIRRVSSLLSGFSARDLAIPSEDGRELYKFDATGRHLETLNALTQAVLYRFAYDGAGRLIEVEDVDGDLVTIERDARAQPSVIVSADGQRTALTLDAQGYLASVRNPAGERHRMSYTADGLLTAFTDPKGHVNRFEYDALVARSACQGHQRRGGWVDTCAHEGSCRLHSVMTTGEGRTSRFTGEPLSTGDRRQVNTSPDGTVETKLFKTNGEKTTTAPDGTVTPSAKAPILD